MNILFIDNLGVDVSHAEELAPVATLCFVAVARVCPVPVAKMVVDFATGMVLRRVIVS